MLCLDEPETNVSHGYIRRLIPCRHICCVYNFTGREVIDIVNLRPRLHLSRLSITYSNGTIRESTKENGWSCASLQSSLFYFSRRISANCRALLCLLWCVRRPCLASCPVMYDGPTRWRMWLIKKKDNERASQVKTGHELWKARFIIIKQYKIPKIF